MAQLPLVGIGAVGNDGTGDPPRTAGGKINAGLTQINTLSGYIDFYSSTYGVIMDNSTDNGVNGSIANWFGAANAAAAGSPAVKARAILRSDATGFMCNSSLRNHFLNGNVELWFEGSCYMVSSGSDDTDPLIVWGTQNVKTTADGYNLAFISQVSGHAYLNQRHMPIRFLCKLWSKHYFRDIQNYTVACQYASNQQNAAYNQTFIGAMTANAYGIEELGMSNDTAFVAENWHHGGDFESTSALATFGSGAVWRHRRLWDGAAYAGQSGSSWEPVSGQILNASQQSFVNKWLPSTTFAQWTRLLGILTGQEWLVSSASGATGTVEPTTLPVPVSVTTITTVAGNAQIVVPNSALIAVNSRIDSYNPGDNFPMNTFVNTIDDGTHVTLSKVARSSSSTVKASFTPPTTSGAATLYCLGDFVRAQHVSVDCSVANWMGLDRCEGGVGAAVSIQGPLKFPRMSSNARSFTLKGHSPSQTDVVRSQFAGWANGVAYVAGNKVIRAALNGVYWLCLTAGTSGGSEPNPVDVVGTTFLDGATLLWTCIALPRSDDYGSYEFLTNNIPDPCINVRSDQEQTVNYAQTPKMDRALRSGTSGAGIWVVPGYNRGSTGNPVSATDFTQAAFSLTRGGIYLLDTTQLIGTYLEVVNWNSFQIYKNFLSGMVASRMYHMPRDKSLRTIGCFSTDGCVQHVLGTNQATNGAGTLNEQSDGSGLMVNAAFDRMVCYDWIGFQKGATACQMSSFGVSARAARISNAVLIPTGMPVNLFNTFQPDLGTRCITNIPTVGKFPYIGEYIVNKNNAVGQPRGWTVTTLGFMGDSWATGLSVREGEIWMDGSKAYAANGTFITSSSGTGPSTTSAPYSATGANIPEATPTSITFGVATWDELGPLAVLRADTNW